MSTIRTSTGRASTVTPRRLFRTLDRTTAIVFGDAADAEKASSAVWNLHGKVEGASDALVGDGEGQPSNLLGDEAVGWRPLGQDPDLLRPHGGVCLVPDRRPVSEVARRGLDPGPLRRPQHHPVVARRFDRPSQRVGPRRPTNQRR